MKGLFKRSNIETELVANRPQAPERLVDSIVGRISPRQAPVRSARARLGLAGALTTAMLVIVGATGGFAAAAQALHLSAAHPASGAIHSACSQYAKKPKITKISPTKGKVGVSVTIKGVNFSGNSKVTSVKFGGGKSAKFKVKNNTTISAKVPKGAKSGAITVKNCKGSASSKKFTVK